MSYGVCLGMQSLRFLSTCFRSGKLKREQVFCRSIRDTYVRCFLSLLGRACSPSVVITGSSSRFQCECECESLFGLARVALSATVNAPSLSGPSSSFLTLPTHATLLYQSTFLKRSMLSHHSTATHCATMTSGHFCHDSSSGVGVSKEQIDYDAMYVYTSSEVYLLKS
jgi:hypothetical protein